MVTMMKDGLPESLGDAIEEWWGKLSPLAQGVFTLSTPLIASLAMMSYQAGLKDGLKDGLRKQRPKKGRAS
jgi:hypothetical protein